MAGESPAKRTLAAGGMDKLSHGWVQQNAAPIPV
ncbi:hypothetical protein LMG29542_06767 [Paraburkholderia humisilvae]|uniref:Uncharacterized protein n=1 Tax=Paraburkholderia humisilvae TaxID=627669 RepID=A0A6J5EZJ9_9BURK|nr:hypothetical protein LMG29542_06767 [Paraburkholderia humisilvae]